MANFNDQTWLPLMKKNMATFKEKTQILSCLNENNIADYF